MKNDLVKEGYNKIAEKYLAQRDQYKNTKYLDKLAELLKPGSLILDMGCGAGLPIDKYFIEKGFRVKGFDISKKQIEIAKKNVPDGQFEVKDMGELVEKEFQVDAIVSFYAIIHVPREEQAELFEKCYSFLPPGGLLLVSMGFSEWEGSEDFYGTKMWWSHFGAAKNKKIIQEAGFKIISEETDRQKKEKHQIFLARKEGSRL